MTVNKVLILDDEVDWQGRIEDHIEGFGLDAIRENNVLRAHNKIANSVDEFLFAFVDVVLTPKGDDRNGLFLLEQLKQSNIGLPCILCTSHLDVGLIADVMIDADYDWIVAIIDKQDFALRPWRISKAINKAKSMRQNVQLERNKTMTMPQDQLAIGVLLEGVKFLFGELGRRLEFWRAKKGETSVPKKFEVVERKGFVIKLDDLEKEVISPVNEDKIRTSLELLKRNSTTLNTYKLEASNPIIAPDRKAFLNYEIPRLEKEIELEGERLQNWIEQSLG